MALSEEVDSCRSSNNFLFVSSHYPSSVFQATLQFCHFHRFKRRRVLNRSLSYDANSTQPITATLHTVPFNAVGTVYIVLVHSHTQLSHSDTGYPLDYCMYEAFRHYEAVLRNAFKLVWPVSLRFVSNTTLHVHQLKKKKKGILKRKTSLILHPRNVVAAE